MTWNMADLFERVADAVPERECLVAGDRRLTYREPLAAASPEREFGARADEDHYVIYTGGTTGMPKGVVWRHDDAFFGMFGGGNYAGEHVSAPDQLADNAKAAAEWVYLIVPPL